MESNVYIYHLKLRKWYKVRLSTAKKMVKAGINDNYCTFKTNDLKFIDLT